MVAAHPPELLEVTPRWADPPKYVVSEVYKAAGPIAAALLFEGTRQEALRALTLLFDFGPDPSMTLEEAEEAYDIMIDLAAEVTIADSVRLLDVEWGPAAADRLLPAWLKAVVGYTRQCQAWMKSADLGAKGRAWAAAKVYADPYYRYFMQAGILSDCREAVANRRWQVPGWTIPGSPGWTEIKDGLTEAGERGWGALKTAWYSWTGQEAEAVAAVKDSFFDLEYLESVGAVLEETTGRAYAFSMSAPVALVQGISDILQGGEPLRRDMTPVAESWWYHRASFRGQFTKLGEWSLLPDQYLRQWWPELPATDVDAYSIALQGSCLVGIAALLISPPCERAATEAIARTAGQRVAQVTLQDAGWWVLRTVGRTGGRGMIAGARGGYTGIRGVFRLIGDIFRRPPKALHPEQIVWEKAGLFRKLRPVIHMERSQFQTLVEAEARKLISESGRLYAGGPRGAVSLNVNTPTAPFAGPADGLGGVGIGTASRAGQLGSSGALVKCAGIVGLVVLGKEYLSSVAFSGFLREEARQTHGFAANRALGKDPDLVAEICRAADRPVLDETSWVPGLNMVKALNEFSEANADNWKTMRLANEQGAERYLPRSMQGRTGAGTGGSQSPDFGVSLMREEMGSALDSAPEIWRDSVTPEPGILHREAETGRLFFIILTTHPQFQQFKSRIRRLTRGSTGIPAHTAAFTRGGPKNRDKGFWTIQEVGTFQFVDIITDSGWGDDDVLRLRKSLLDPKSVQRPEDGELPAPIPETAADGMARARR